MQNLIDLWTQWVSLSLAPEHALFHSSNHHCTTGLDQENLAELCIPEPRGAAWQCLRRKPYWVWKRTLGKGDPTCRKTRRGWKSVQTIFYLSAQVKTTKHSTNLCRRNSWIPLSLVKKMKSLRAARSEMGHMFTEFESPSGGAAQAAEGHRSKLLCAQTPALPSIFQCSPPWYRQGYNLLFITISFTSQRKAETILRQQVQHN